MTLEDQSPASRIIRQMNASDVRYDESVSPRRPDLILQFDD
jgi:hypothetical protein